MASIVTGASEAKTEEFVITEEDRKDKSKLNKKIDELDDKEYPVKERLALNQHMVEDGNLTFAA